MTVSAPGTSAPGVASATYPGAASADAGLGGLHHQRFLVRGLLAGSVKGG